MTAAERAKALDLGEPAECPRCDAILRVDRQQFSPSVSCPKCGYRASVAMAGITGRVGDDTAAIQLLDTTNEVPA